MSFEDAMDSALSQGAIGSERFRLAYKDRPHVSKSAIDHGSNAAYLDLGGSYQGTYSAARARYVVATGITYDMLITLYDVNSGDALVLRPYDFNDVARSSMSKYIAATRKSRPNLEARVIGMQSKQGASQLHEILDLIKENKMKLVEADLFGTDVRHIAFDTKLGTSRDVLVNDRLYRPGELANTQTPEQFARSIKR